MRMPVCRSTSAMKSPPLSASRVALVARGDDLVDLVRLGEAPELGQRLERGGHRGRRQAAAVEAAGAEPDHVLFAVDDLERQIRPDLHHDHVDRVGADVDGGDAHAGRLELQLGPGLVCYMAVIYWRTGHS